MLLQPLHGVLEVYISPIGGSIEAKIEKVSIRVSAVGPRRQRAVEVVRFDLNRQVIRLLVVL